MNEKLRNALGALRKELEALDVDSEEHVHLRQLVDDIERQLDRPAETHDLSERIEQLPKVLERFELEHPRLTRTLNEIMITLGNMGI